MILPLLLQAGILKDRRRGESVVCLWTPAAIASGHMNMVTQFVDIFLFIGVRVAVFLKHPSKCNPPEPEGLICDLRSQSTPAKLTYSDVNYPIVVYGP